jgi:hypothetical protein
MQLGLYRSAKSITVWFDTREQVRRLAADLTRLAEDDTVRYGEDVKASSLNFMEVTPVKGTKRFTSKVSVRAGERRAK